MPEPNYAGGEPPGLFTLVVGSIVVLILFLVIKSCMWGG